jgi:hypothetical protein
MQKPTTNNKFRIGDQVIASPSFPTIGWAGKKTGVIVGQGREPGMVRVQIDDGWGKNQPQLWWEGHWLLRDSSETIKALDDFEVAVQQTVKRLESDNQAKGILREALRRCGELEREKFVQSWRESHPLKLVK